MKTKQFSLIPAILFLTTASLFAQNPVIRDNFSADPSAHVFEGRVYIYPSHDIPAPSDYGRKDWFCMADYHVYSSDDLVNWVDHGVIVDQKKVPWVNPTGYSMWAPDCNYNKTTQQYYFFFPAGAKQGSGFNGNCVGVAISKTPYGPFVPQEAPIKGVSGIDPCIFVDDDGTPYLTWAGRGLQIAKLKPNMLELDGEPVTITGLPSQGLKEGPFLFKRNGIYYFTFPWAEKERETLAYCMSDKPMGPYKFVGKFMEQSKTCWTNHHSVIEWKGKWYLFNHHNDYSPFNDKNRSVCIDFLNFNEDGTIVPVVRTLRGVGETRATDTIQIDRYSQISDSNAKIDFVDVDNLYEGWKVIFWNTTSTRNPIFVSYDRVDFGSSDLHSVTMRYKSPAGGRLELHADSPTGPLLAKVEIPSRDNNEWAIQSAPVMNQVKGLHTLYLTMTAGCRIEVDWVRFQ